VFVAVGHVGVAIQRTLHHPDHVGKCTALEGFATHGGRHFADASWQALIQAVLPGVLGGHFANLCHHGYEFIKDRFENRVQSDWNFIVAQQGFVGMHRWVFMRSSQAFKCILGSINSRLGQGSRPR